MANENKLVKTVIDSAVLIGLASGVGYLARKVIKEPFINDPSSSITNYAKWVPVLSGSMYLKNYMEAQNILPKPTLKC